MCKAKYPRQPDKRDAMFKQKNCRTVAPQPLFEYRPTHSMTGHAVIKYSTCPPNLFNSGTLNLINMVNSFAEGLMPYSGGLLEQPAKFVEVMELVHNLKEEYNTEQTKKMDKYNGKRGKR